MIIRTPIKNSLMSWFMLKHLNLLSSDAANQCRNLKYDNTSFDIFRPSDPVSLKYRIVGSGREGFKSVLEVLVFIGHYCVELPQMTME